MSRITKIEAVKKQPKKKIRVAAYARVSTGSDKQLASLHRNGPALHSIHRSAITSSISRQDRIGIMPDYILTKV